MFNKASDLWSRVAPIAPNIFSSTRIIAAPFLWSLLSEETPFSFIFYVAVCATDVLDGNIVRSLKSTTIGGSVLDASADFALVFAGFLFYTNNGIVSPTLLLAMGASFAYYLLTAKTVVQSVFGKHIGTVLFVLLGFTILSPSRIVGICVSLIGVLYITVSTIIRFNCIRKAHHIA